MEWSSVTNPYYVGPCHHGMACSCVLNGGDSLWNWRVAANILNKQPWTTDRKSGLPAWGLGSRLTTPDCGKPTCKGMSHRASEFLMQYLFYHRLLWTW